MITLRPYQQALIDGGREAYRQGKRSVLFCLPTGGGKTVTASTIVHGAAQKRNVVWWLCHRRELVSQASTTFYAMGIPHGVVQGGHATDPGALVQVGSIQTVANRVAQLPEPALIVFDECHHIGAASWDALFHRFPRAKVLGLSATPWRLDGQGLGRWFEHMVTGPTVAELIEQGSLSPYRLFAPAMPDLSGVGTAAGDFKRDALSAAMDKPQIVGDAIAHYNRLCPGKRAVAFAAGVDNSKRIAAQFVAAGIPAEHVDGSMSAEARDAAVERFKAGQTLVLSNADLFGEGFDVPAIEAAILLRPTKSLSLHLQQVGRALRPLPGKTEAIILDHAGNSLRHGLPDHERALTSLGFNASSTVIGVGGVLILVKTTTPRINVHMKMEQALVLAEVLRSNGLRVDVRPSFSSHDSLRDQISFAAGYEHVILPGGGGGFLSMLLARGTHVIIPPYDEAEAKKFVKAECLVRTTLLRLEANRGLFDENSVLAAIKSPPPLTPCALTWYRDMATSPVIPGSQLTK